MATYLKHQNGFTLLEVMIAISIFSFLAVGSYQLLNSEINAQERLSAHSAKLYNWQRSMRLILSDFQQLSPRPIRAEYGDKESAMLGLSDSVSFTRSGWANPFQHKRSTQQRVQYELDRDDDGNSYLVRRYFQVLDRGQDSESREQVIMRDIEEIRFRYRDKSGKWFDKWPPTSSTSETKDKDLPVTIEFHFDSLSLGEFSRTININRVQPKPAPKPDEPEDSDDIVEDGSTDNSGIPPGERPTEIAPDREMVRP
jgi:general secretion pathway protein J